jgi:murein L,D-transpeptidase YafK
LPGEEIVIHGMPNGLGLLGTAHLRKDWTIACIALTDDEIAEVWRVVPNGTSVEIRQ